MQVGGSIDQVGGIKVVDVVAGDNVWVDFPIRLKFVAHIFINLLI